MSLLYHHCRDFASIKDKEIRHYPRFADPELLPCYRYLQSFVKFFPIFFSVGKSVKNIYMTGYANQFSNYSERNFGRGGRHIRRQPNYVLFSYKKLNGMFTDFNWWEAFLDYATESKEHLKNLSSPSFQLYFLEKVFGTRKFSKEQWLEKSRRKPYSVQLIRSTIDTTKADRVICRNEATKYYLEKRGYKNVKVLRIPTSYNLSQKVVNAYRTLR